MARRSANQELNAWLDRHGYRHDHAKKRETKAGQQEHLFTYRNKHNTWSDVWAVDVEDAKRKISERKDSSGFYSINRVTNVPPRESTSHARVARMAHVNVKETFAAIRAAGASVKRNEGEWRVNVPGGTEAMAYYTDNAEDAIATAKAMMDRVRSSHARMVHQEPTGRAVFAAHERDHHITTSGRRSLKAGQFALPPSPEENRRGIRGRLPIDTVARARSALARASMMHHQGHLTARQLATARRKIHAAWPSIEIEPTA